MSDNVKLDFVPDFFGIDGGARIAIQKPGLYHVTESPNGGLMIEKLELEERMTGRTDEYDNPIFERVVKS